MSVLLGFSVSNFKSFRETQKISFCASDSRLNHDHILPLKNCRVLRSALLYGGNASGKTNLIKAVDFSQKVILYGLYAVNLIGAHFRIDSDCYQQPGVFEYRIMVGKIEYSYGLVISYTKGKIVSEWLVRLGNEEKYIFNRTNSDKGSMVETEVNDEINNENDKNRFTIYLNDFSKNISPELQKKTILSDLAIRGEAVQGIFREIVEIYDFFKNILIIYPNTKYAALNSIASDKTLNVTFSKLLNEFDTGIVRLECKRQLVDFDEVFVGLPKEVLDKFKIDISKNLDGKRSTLRPFNGRLLSFSRSASGELVTERLVLNHGNPDDMFDLKDESDGTIRLFDLLPLLTFKNTATILIDEIERSLHPLLVKTFLSLFYKLMAQSKSYSQLLATTHEISLLDTDLIRQDELWFVKRKDDHSSSVYSLNKYSIVNSDDIKKAYMLGKFGAIPDIAPVSSLLEDAFHEE